MSITFNLAVGQEDTGGEVLVDETLDGLINLRSAADSYATAAYTGALVDHGVYTFTGVVPGIYKVYNDTTELTIYGQIQIGQSDAVLNTGNETIAGVKTFSSAPIFSSGFYTDTIAEKTSSAGITFAHKAIMNQLFLTSMGRAFSMGGFDISGLVDPVGGSSAVCKTYADTNYFQKTGSTAQSIPSTIATTFRGLTYYTRPTLTSPLEVANVKYVKDYVNTFLSGQASTEQQTLTKVIVDYNGTQIDGKRYTTITSALAYTDAQPPTADLRYTIEIEGGQDTGSLSTDFNVLATQPADYTDIVGLNQGVIIYVADDTYAADSLGVNILENVTINCAGSSPTPAFTNWIFRNCKFITDSSGTYTLTGCVLDNCSREDCSITYSGCIGNCLDIENEQEVILHNVMDEGGAYEISYANGDIRGKRVLGRWGSDVASASSITVGEGNVFFITGTTTINLMNTSGWTAGSRITLSFNSNVTVNHLTASSTTYMPFFWKSGANKNVLANEVFDFVLSKNSDVWLEV